MKKVKNWILVLSVAVPGMFAYSCSGGLLMQVRDAVVDGTSAAVEVATFNWIDSFVPEPEEEAAE